MSPQPFYPKNWHPKSEKRKAQKSQKIPKRKQAGSNPQPRVERGLLHWRTPHGEPWCKSTALTVELNPPASSKLGCFANAYQPTPTLPTTVKINVVHYQ
jgi:hypothetical protein